MTTPLLPFHKSILSQIHDPSTSDFLLLARGLGLRKLVCTLLKIYDSPQNLVLLVNAAPDEEAAIGEELGIMGCRKPGLRIVGYEMPKRERQDLYKKGGLISITSRILVVDMLQSDIPTELISGILVLHAEKVTPLSLEAFIIRLYREKNEAGFLKAFSDQPENITSGLSPLKTIMKELQLRKVHIYPRFHEEIQASLERRKADVVELHQPMTESMQEIHFAIIQCMNATLSELKKGNTTLDLDDLNVENAYFRSFDMIARHQLDPVWHQVGPKTKQLVGDLATLRHLLTYLLTYDPLAFQTYIETIIDTNSTKNNPASNRSPWLSTDYAHIMFQAAKRRCFVSSGVKKDSAPQDNQEAWDVLDELEGQVPSNQQQRPSWLPRNIEPVLEELPKWSLLAETLKEIEELIIKHPTSSLTPGSNTVLIMVASNRTCALLREFLATMDPNAPAGAQGKAMMEGRLRNYLAWKGGLSRHGSPPPVAKSREDGSNKDAGLSEALKRKDATKKDRAANRRRVRGGPPGSSGIAHSERTRASTQGEGLMREEGTMRDEADEIAEFLATQRGAPSTWRGSSLAPETLIRPSDQESVTEGFGFSEFDFDTHYGLLTAEETVIVRAYSDDTDDQVLAEVQPRFIILFEPSQDFIRRIEVYRSSNPGLAVRVYFLMYLSSYEEQKYLAGLRREKEAFTRLIKERATMLIPIQEKRDTTGGSEAVIKTLSTRIAGGGKVVNSQPSQVIVDMREFRSSLPSLLHAAKLLVIPATLTVGDYILTPDICVERKSVSDLVGSFNNGRLYTQCELMSVHYKQPILLIEFEQNKSFSLQTLLEAKSGAKSSSKYPTKNVGPEADKIADSSIQSKLVLLTLAFPRLRIIWSSSPYATADIFADLKLNNAEPDPTKAIAVGAEEDADPGAAVNAQAEELLRSLPGITAKNVKYVMSKVNSVRELCELEMKKVQEILGVEPGKALWEFIHKGLKNG